MSTSTAYVIIQSLGYRYSFDGVTSISHSLNLKVSTDSDSQEDGDYVNNARNEPDVVTLSVVASDANVPVLGWARQTLTSLCQIKELRLLCQVITNLRTYSNMLLTSISVQQDETCPDGWTGTLTFTHTDSVAVTTKTEDNSSTPVSTGSASARSVGSKSSGSGSGSSGSQSSSVLQTILWEAGIKS